LVDGDKSSDLKLFIGNIIGRGGRLGWGILAADFEGIATGASEAVKVSASELIGKSCSFRIGRVRL